MTYKHILKIVMPVVLALTLLTQCDSVTSGNDDVEQNESITLISPVNSATNQSLEVELQWEQVEGYSAYNIKLSETESFDDIIIDETVEGSSYEAVGLSPDETYYWKVYPMESNDSGPWSEVWNFTTGDENSPPASGSFVEVQNSNFVIDGQVTRFAGTNAYYLPNYEKLNSGVVDRAFDLFEDTGVNVVRMWGFYDGYDCGYSKNDPNENVIQTAPGEYDERALQDLDRVIAKGIEHGVKFIIPFVNYWDELGGICQYNTWAGASSPSQNMEFFINNDQTQQWFRDYIDMLLNRENTVTGVKYKDEPAIFAWQIINEGRNSGGDPQLIRDWYQDIAQYIKSIDSNHLVGTGEEGFDEGTPSEYSTEEYSNTYVLRAQQGTSYVMNTAIPEIDFGSAHWYPNEWGFGTTINDDLLRAQRAWLGDHQAIAESHGKPFIIGEFGFPGWGDDRVEEMYKELYSEVESQRVDGNLLWQLVADGTKCWEFGGNICYPGGREDTQLYNPFRDHVEFMRTLR